MAVAQEAPDKKPFVTESEVSFRVGYRVDQLDWNIASDPSGTHTPNILSELTWDDIESVELQFDFSGKLASQFYYHLDLSIAGIRKGKNQDSDYHGNNRTLEFSRSNNNASDGYLGDISGAIGYPIQLDEDGKKRFRLTPLLGYSYHRQNFSITDGEQTLASAGTPPLGPIAGLDSSYEAEWYGPWFGFELAFVLAPGVNLDIQFEHHVGEYLGVGNWNLREDFQHPRSFEHIADSSGNSLFLSLVIDRGWLWIVSAQFQKWQTDAGTDRIFFSDDTSVTTRLNEVNWQSNSLSFGVVVPY
ncbi:MAG: hypothetical protein KUG72_02715 [Pseudomonadales bacterium]|nr:hypothetical protein [Pseudomonadales bacterium]